MVTLMRDLAALTTLAHDTFSNVSERVSDMATRTSQLAERAEAALADVDALRVAIDAETSVLRLAHAPPVEWHASMPSGPGVDRELITNDTLGKPWATWREEAVPPPAELDMLDQLDEVAAGARGLQKLELSSRVTYSDPGLIRAAYLRDRDLVKAREAEEKRVQRAARAEARRQNSRTTLTTNAQPSARRRYSSLAPDELARPRAPTAAQALPVRDQHDASPVSVAQATTPTNGHTTSTPPPLAHLNAPRPRYAPLEVPFTLEPARATQHVPHVRDVAPHTPGSRPWAWFFCWSCGSHLAA